VQEGLRGVDLSSGRWQVSKITSSNIGKFEEISVDTAENERNVEV